MHPSLSIVFFTTASGAGFALLMLLGLAVPLGLLPASVWFGFVALAIAIVLAVAGLVSSVFHLGRPERAWRAFSQWRSSWLSREGVASAATYIPALLLWIAWLTPGASEQLIKIAGIATVLMALITVCCTAKIYSTLITIR